METAKVDNIGPFDGRNVVALLGIEDYTKPKRI